MYKRRDCYSFVFIFIIIVFLFLFSYLSFDDTVQRKLELKQVLMLSRHNVRTPLSKNLTKMTRQKWPHWNKEPGYLTEKGFLLESYMGRFFGDWLRNEGVLQDGCPSDEDFFVYANILERTMSSAKAFIRSGFPNCTVTINHTNGNRSDPIFSPYIHNSTKIFKEIALKEMKEVFKRQHLNGSLKNLENILNYNKSDLCQLDGKCSLVRDKNKFNIKFGKKPKITGPLKISNEAIDCFLMEYYNGLPDYEIAWGKLDHNEQWNNILDICNLYHNIQFNTTHIAKDIAKPLIKYMTNIFLNSTQKVTLLMGHDANINVILNALRIKAFKLKESFSKTPVGGKIVFEKWLVVDTNEYLLRLFYVYQSNEQLRNGMPLSLDNPPHVHMLELNDCKIDENGYCLWIDFMDFLNHLWD